MCGARFKHRNVWWVPYHPCLHDQMSQWDQIQEATTGSRFAFRLSVKNNSLCFCPGLKCCTLNRFLGPDSHKICQSRANPRKLLTVYSSEIEQYLHFYYLPKIQNFCPNFEYWKGKISTDVQEVGSWC